MQKWHKKTLITKAKDVEWKAEQMQHEKERLEKVSLLSLYLKATSVCSITLSDNISEMLL